MMMVCAGFQLLEAQFGGLLCGCNFKFQQYGIYFYYRSSIRLLPDWLSRNYVAHGVPSRPTNPAPWATSSPAVSLQEQSYIFPSDASGIHCQTVCVSVPIFGLRDLPYWPQYRRQEYCPPYILNTHAPSRTQHTPSCPNDSESFLPHHRPLFLLFQNSIFTLELHGKI